MDRLGPIKFKGFQSTHPRGVRPKSCTSLLDSSRVSIHAPAWGATRGPLLILHHVLCFNPRTRVGCDISQAKGIILFLVSIHAPAWGATCRAWSGLVRNEFQSTHPRGVRRQPCQSQARPARVSIHAPAWGATHFLMITFNNTTCFNPRTRVGCDFSSSTRRLHGEEFQSTHPRGVRQKRCLKLSEPEKVSIHAPAWGATSPSRVVKTPQEVSIHAPAWGATPPVIKSSQSSQSFNPRTRVGCDAEQ